jgi:hypothetical protein
VKLTIEVDCTPEEARTFLGLPDVRALNEKLVEEMQSRLSANLSLLSPDDLLKNWASFGIGAQEQFRKLMATVVDMGKRTASGGPGGSTSGG